MTSLYVTADRHINGESLPSIIKKQNDFINQKVDSNSSLYKESYFLNSWLLAYGAGNEEIVYLRFFDSALLENSGCFGFLCLKVNRKTFTTEYSNAGFLFGYPGPAILPGKEFVFFTLLQHWLSTQRHFWFCKIGPTRDALHKVVSLNGLENFSQSFAQTSAPYFIMNSSYRPPSENLRQNLRTKSRLLMTKSHEFIYLSSIADPRFPLLFEMWVEMLKARWPNGHFARDESRQKKFYLLLAENLSATGQFLFTALFIDQEPAAINFGIIQGARFYSFTPAMNEGFAAFGPSQLLLRDLASELPKRGISIFDFMNDMETYKLQWANDVAPRFEYELYSHFFMRSRFKYRWGPKFFMRRFFRIKNYRRLLSNPAAAISDFRSRG